MKARISLCEHMEAQDPPKLESCRKFHSLWREGKERAVERHDGTEGAFRKREAYKAGNSHRLCFRKVSLSATGRQTGDATLNTGKLVSGV